MTPSAAGVSTYSPRTPAAPRMCIVISVPTVHIYLDRELHSHIKRLNIGVSGVCQKALRAEVERAIRDFYTRHPKQAGGTLNPREAS